ncbi:tripartite tricarboxylate transporter substrate binding protein [Cupriavidus taiwanensis]|uniref:Extra-cytoplasmic solute receptor n=1 Tax=Cupriavidus taiwanensis TaxID=164546 RepID=A0A375IV83_9BURK|nr:tripartite tricarboxylate transporter substrate binding protein [Cupriavidus taiwanensis]SPR96565.1 conserved exported hypothetical protein [Cupriavidus taiwanensis]
MRLSAFGMLSLAILASLPVLQAKAQERERAPLRLVVPYAAGGTTDYVARLLQKPLGEFLKQTVIVENRPGAAGTIGTDNVAKAPADGNTLLFGNQGPNALAPTLRKTPYDALNDLRPLTTIAFMPLVLMTSAEKGPRSLELLLQQARKPGANVNYGSSGIGSLAHLTAVEFSRRGKLEMTHIPYQGGSQVATGLLQGDIQCSFATSLESASMVRSGRMRVLGVAAAHRVPSMPHIPAIAEVLPGFESVLWFAAFAPKGTRDEDAIRLRDALVKAVESADFRRYLAENHAEARASTPEQLTQLIQRDMQHWADVARTARVAM